MMKNILFALITLTSSVCYSAQPTPNELRELLIDSVLLDLYNLSEVEGADERTVKLSAKIGALIRSYESTIEAQTMVIFRLKELLDENNVKVSW